MGPEPDTPKSNDLFRQRLDELINPKHPLAQLARHIDWVVFWSWSTAVYGLNLLR